MNGIKMVDYNKAEKEKTYNYVKQEFSFGAVQDFHQVADALFPDVKSVLSSRSGAHVLPIPRETALLPHGSTNRYTETVISVLRLPSPQQLFLKTKKKSRDRQKYLNLPFATIYYKTQSNRDVETAD